MSEVIVFIPINSVPVTERNKSTVLMVNYPFVKASDYDQLRKQLDEADEVLGRKNARIAEFAERHLKDFVELERLDKQLEDARKQLDEARELLEMVGSPRLFKVDEWYARIDAWLEAHGNE